jgi:hypothetical protein
MPRAVWLLRSGRRHRALPPLTHLDRHLLGYPVPRAIGSEAPRCCEGRTPTVCFQPATIGRRGCRLDGASAKPVARSGLGSKQSISGPKSSAVDASGYVRSAAQWPADLDMLDYG